MATEKKTLKKIIDLTQKASCRHEKKKVVQILYIPPPRTHTKQTNEKKNI